MRRSAAPSLNQIAKRFKADPKERERNHSQQESAENVGLSVEVPLL